MAMKQPLVSAVITTKNEEKNIARLLKSIKKQSYRNLEIIVVDNHSSDSTVEIAKKYTTKVFNKGPERSAQRNFGAEKARGKYLLILDADMELTTGVVESCVKEIEKSRHKALIVPERTEGRGFVARVRKFERQMYMGDPSIEVARFFDKRAFKEFGGYDKNLTGTEDYDLPARLSKKYTIGWSKKYIIHHEGGLTLKRQLEKKYYYASKSAAYVDKHPQLIVKQGILIFRKAYLKHWRRFVKKPLLGISLLFLRVLESLAALAGYMSAVGPVGVLKAFVKMVRS